MCLLTIDIDHFKRINDNYGHKVGDLAIKYVVDLCLQQTRESDIFGRLGGEEFGLLLPETDGVQAIELAERVRKKVANSPFEFDQESIDITVSIGIAKLDIKAKNSSLEDLTTESDLALYQAKNSGRNKVCIYSADSLGDKGLRISP